MDNLQLFYVIAFAPLVGSLIAGLFGAGWLGGWVSRRAADAVTILGVAISFACSLAVFWDYAFGGAQPVNVDVYTWLTIGGMDVSVGFMIDSLAAMMMVVVTFVSLMVHVYSIGYMEHDEGYQRFFSYISLFTFSMLMLLMSNNFAQLFFGWEAVGLVSYLLIGFYYKRPSAIRANLKAFLLNRVGDMGFVLGIGVIVAYFGGSLNYADVFDNAPFVKDVAVEVFEGAPWRVPTIAALCLFVGAAAKSAQFPLHTWLPDSMEGPTPISALIHAATMVTAGIFMITRMSPIFEMSETALTVIMVCGSITALFMGLVGVVQNDVKRVIAYSTLSQLGYMTVALSASAYAAGMFHVVTHAFFKALLFLAAGSVIMAMRHDQDMRNMGGLRKSMPITWATMLIGSLSLIGTPFFSGFYSKESIIEAVKLSNLGFSGMAYWVLVASVFVTAFYSFRLYFLVFHGEERWRKAHVELDGAVSPALKEPEGGHEEHGEHAPGLPASADAKEPGWTVTLPLILLAIPSVIVGCATIDPVLYGGWLQGVHVDPLHGAMGLMAEEWSGAGAMGAHGFLSLPFWLAAAGVFCAYWMYLRRPDLPGKIKDAIRPVYDTLVNKYYLDWLYIDVFAKGCVKVGKAFWKGGDVAAIDNGVVNNSAKLVGATARGTRKMQTGYLYTYAAVMVFGLLCLIVYWFLPLWF